jgi:hypothetical protein
MKKSLMRSALMLVATAFAAAPVAAQDAVTTYHYDPNRTGWNHAETQLTTSNVTSSTFGLLSLTNPNPVPLDDQVDAQPLVVPCSQAGISCTNDVVYVATENNTVYAIDSSNGAVLVSTNLGPPVPEPLGCGNNGPNVGINGTPVIDLTSNTLYVIAYINGPAGPTYQLYALNLSNLQGNTSINGGTPVTVAATHFQSNGSTFSFNPTNQRQRPGLLLENGNVYAAFGSFCDFHASYLNTTPPPPGTPNATHHSTRGQLLGWSAATLQPLSGSQPGGTANQLNNRLADDPVHFFLTSIWMSGYGIASDPPADTNIYFATGNSDCNWQVSPEQCPPTSSWDGANLTPPHPYNI